MTSCSRALRNVTITLGYFGPLLIPIQSGAQTIPPTQIEVALISTNDTTVKALNNNGEFTAIPYSTPTRPLPQALPSGNYPAWCGTRNGDAFGNNTYTVTTTPPAQNTISPAQLSNPTIWNEINYILNNKASYSIGDVQAAIWGILNGLCSPTSTVCTSASYLQSRAPSAYPLYNAAITTGTTFTPAAGQVSMALLINPTAGAQHIIIERLAGGAIGDRIWWDADNDGIQETNTLTNPLPASMMQSIGYYFDGKNSYSYQFAEQGLNGIKVDLYTVDAFGHPSSTPVASTTTVNSPASYPYMPAGTAGWYQFTGLGAGNYQVRLDVDQAAIAGRGLVPTKYYATTADLDSNDPVNGANATITDGYTPPNDETLDFGFTGAAPLSVTCAAPTGKVGQPYSSAVVPSGGVPPYAYSIAGGALPNGLTLHADTGVIDGTPTLDGSFNFTVQVKDASGLAAGTVPSSCGITIARSMTIACANGSAQVGVNYSSALVASNGVAPYTYSALDPLPDGLTLNPATGAITGAPANSGLFSFRVQAADSTGTSAGTISNRCAINVVPPNITPKCVNNVATAGNSYLSKLTATGGTGTGYTFAIVGGDAALPPGLHLDTTNWTITGTPTTPGTYSFTIQVTDSAGNTGTAICGITVSAQLTVVCASGSGFVGTYNSAMNVTGGSGQFTYSLSAGSLPAGLTLDAATGAIAGTATAAGTYSFTVTVLDKVTGATAGASCTIVIYPQPTLVCNAGPTTVGAQLVATLAASGGSGHYSYSLAAGTPSWIGINSTTGAISGLATQATGVTPLVVTGMVTDSAGGTATTTSAGCSIVINNPPSIACAAAAITGTVGAPFTPAPPTVTGGSGSYNFSVAPGGALPAGLSLNPATGAVGGTPQGPGSFSLQATDSRGIATAASCPYTVVPAPVIACATATGTVGTVGAPFNPPAPTVSNGAAPYTFSIAPIAGSILPSGLALDPKTGAVSGMPLAAGSFSIQVTDANGAVAVGLCPYSVAAKPVMTCAASNLTSGTVGGAFNAPALTINGGVSPYTFSLATGQIPAGLTLDTATGAVGGTPSAPGSFTLKVTDANGATAGGTCGYSVAPKPALACVATGATGEVNLPFNAPPITVSGGVGPYTFSVASGSMPLGLNLNTSTGAITGTPATTGAFTIQATDANNVTAAGTCAYSAASNPVISCSANAPTGMIGYPFSAPAPTVNGGAAPFTFSVAGTLPAGLKLNADGSVTGTPLSAGSFSIRATDTAGVTTVGACAMTILPAPVAQCAAIANAIVGVAITPVTLTGSGGVGGPYTFKATGLPQGLTMSTGGTISGAPLIGGSFIYSVQVIDASGNVGTINCSVVVAGGNMCGLTWGYWKNHVWPAYVTASGLVLGGKTYTADEIRNILASPVAGDASLDLGHQLIAAWMNVYNGTDIRTDTNNAISNADALLKAYAGKIPLGVPSTDPNGALMVTYARQLDYFNQDGKAQPGCANGPMTLTLACAASTGVVDAAYRSAVVASGGMGAPFAYAITSGALPAGLTLDAATGAITGVPITAGTFNFTVTAHDSSYTSGTTGTVSSNCSITINPNPVVSNCVTITPLQGAAITPVTLTATSGAGGPYTFTATGLPAGLTMSTTGTISGAPTVTGTFSYTVTAKDKPGNTGTVNCSVTVSGGQMVGAGDTATIGFWHNKNGQALILSMNGSSASTKLANWLAATFPALYGNSSSNDLTGKTNKDVAALFMTFFNVSGTKTYAQVMGGALAMYVTNSSLAGGLGAASYGFNVSANGTGARLYNTGADGATIGLANNTNYTVAQLMQAANGVAPYNSAEFGALNTIFDGINQSGDII